MEELFLCLNWHKQIYKIQHNIGEGQNNKLKKSSYTCFRIFAFQGKELCCLTKFTFSNIVKSIVASCAFDKPYKPSKLIQFLRFDDPFKTKHSTQMNRHLSLFIGAR